MWFALIGLGWGASELGRAAYRRRKLSHNKNVRRVGKRSYIYAPR